MAVIYCKYETGSTTYRLTDLTTCIASNPSGTITRITKTAHGLVNGQVVELTLFSTWLNRVWTVTNAQTNTFDLLEAVWQTTADNDGTVRPFNGFSWASAIREPRGIISAISQTAKPEIEIRIEKSPDPYSIGNGTWTNGGGAVTLATAQTATIDNCETAWTAANGATVTRVNTLPVKQGLWRMQIAVPAVPAINTKYAYYALPATLDLSAYQRISYWLGPSATNSIDADTEYKICLCSDTLGDTIVDEFILPRNTNSSNLTLPFVVTKNGGGNLGSSIKSIALYTSTTTPTGSTNIRLDNIIACTTTGLNLTSLISKSSSATYNHSQEAWYGIDYIDGTTVELGGNTTYNWDNSVYRSYKYVTSGTSPETVTTYAREQLIHKNPTHTQSSLNLPYAADNYFIVNGGWNSSNDTLDGMSFIRVSGVINFYGISSNAGSSSAVNRNNRLKNLGLVIFGGLYNGTSWQRAIEAENCHIINSYDRPIAWSSAYGLILSNCTFTSNWANQYFEITATQSTLNNVKSLATGDRFNMKLDNSIFSNLYFLASSYNGIPAHTLLLSDTCESSNITIQSVPSQSGNNNNVGLELASTQPFYSPSIINGLTVRNCHTAVVNSGGITILNNPNFVGNTYSVETRDLSDSRISKIILNNLTSTDTNFIRIRTGLNQVGAFSKFIVINNTVGGNKNVINHYYKTVPQTGGVADIAWAATVSAQTAVRKSATGIAWQINPLTNQINETYPFFFKIATVAVNASSQVTVKAWVKLSHATDIGAKLYIPNDQTGGPANAVSTNKSADTNWEELTVTFTPSIQGVVDVYVEAFWKANAADESVYVDDVTVTQA